MLPKRRVHTAEDLEQIAEALGEDPELIEREFILMTIAAHLAESQPSLCLKGGFVFRNVHGQQRFSKDVDSTQNDPPKHKIDNEQLRNTILGAVRGLNVNLVIPEPRNDKHAVSFDNIAYKGLRGGKGYVTVEVSYREGLVDKPVQRQVGPPFYDEFDVNVLTGDEAQAEKIRALRQRAVPTDLADAAFMIREEKVFDGRVAEIVPIKFKLVSEGNHLEIIDATIGQMKSDYERTIPSLVEDHIPYDDAAKLVRSKLKVYLSKV